MLTPSLPVDLLLLSIIAVILLHTWSLAQRSLWWFFDPLNTFWAGILICYLIQPLNFADTLLSWHDEDIFIKTLLAALLGIGFVLLGYESRLGPAMAARIPMLPPTLSSSRLLGAGVLLLLIGAIGYALIISVSGGWQAWIAIGRGGTDYEQVKGYLPELIQAVPAGIFILFLRAQIRRNQSGLVEKTLCWATAALLLWWFFYIGSRSRLITAFLLFLAAHYMPRGTRPNLVLAALLFLALMIATNIQEHYRGNFTNLKLNLGEVDFSEFWARVLPMPLGGDRDLQRAEVSRGIEFNCAMSVVDLVPDTVSYNYGSGFLELVTRPVPRSLWPGKRYPHMESLQGVLREANLTEATTTTLDGRQLLMGPAFSFVGHWFYVGGFVGMALGGLITGVLFRFIRSLMDKQPESHSGLLLYPFLLTIGFGEAASTPWYWFFNLPFIVLPFVAVIYFAAENGLRNDRKSETRKKAEIRTPPEAIGHYVSRRRELS